MTEINDNRERYRLDTLPFIAAFLGGPLIVTLCAFWIYYIPVLALIYGGPVYVIVGLPAALVHLKFHEGSPRSLILLALQSVTVVAIPVGLFATALGGGVIALIMIGLSYIFAAAWSATAALIYDKFRSANSRIPHPLVPRKPRPQEGAVQ